MAELHNYRSKYKCHKCHKRHREPLKVEEKVTKNMVHHGEWYEISEELGLATVQKWRGWLATSNLILLMEFYGQAGPQSWTHSQN